MRIWISWKIPATAMMTSRMTMMIAVAGRRISPRLSGESNPSQECREMCWGPRRIEGPNYMEEEVVTVGRAGRLSITPRQNVPVV